MPLDTNETYLLWGYLGANSRIYWWSWVTMPEDLPVVATYGLFAGIDYTHIAGDPDSFELGLNRLTHIVAQANTEQRWVVENAMHDLINSWNRNDIIPTHHEPSAKWTHRQPMQWLGSEWLPRWQAAIASSPPLLRLKLLFMPTNLGIPEAAPEFVNTLYQAKDLPHASLDFSFQWSGWRNDGYFDQARLREIALTAASRDLRRFAMGLIWQVDDNFRRQLLLNSIGSEPELMAATFNLMKKDWPSSKCTRWIDAPQVVWANGPAGRHIANEAAIRAWWRDYLGG